MRQFFLSLFLHALLLTLLLLGLNRSDQTPIVNKGPKIIHAVAIENTEIKRIEKQQQEQKKMKELAEAEKLRQAQEKAKALRLAEEKRAEEVKAAAEKKQAEEKAIALQKKKDEENKKRLAEEEKKKEQERLKKIKEEQEKQHQKALEKEKAEAQKLKEKQQYEAAVALQKKIAAKQAEIAKQRAEAISGIVDQYKGMILEAIAAHWLVPSGIDPSLACQLMISVDAHGQVNNVQLIKTSGNVLLDQSAIAAVYKASPLPMPPDADAALVFKQFSLTLKPEQLV